MSGDVKQPPRAALVAVIISSGLLSLRCNDGRRCPEGYRSAGQHCVDIDECAIDNGGCDPLALCTNGPGSRSCGPCPEGYTGDGYEGCEDIDECATDNGGCDPLTVCTNGPGSSGCGPCPGGYTGDGYEGCEDTDECATDNGGCDPLTVCTNGPGSRSCGPCPKGYAGNGDEGCEDVDECAIGNGGCDPLTLCTNSPGSRSCGPCPEGYTGSGYEGCEDIDECAIDNGGCDPLTLCTNKPGSWECGPCPPGHAGDAHSGCYLGVNLITKNIYFDSALSCGIHLDWDDALDVGGQRIAAYAVYRDGYLIASASSSLFEDFDAEPGLHTYTVRSVDQDGQESVASNAATISSLDCHAELSKDGFVMQQVDAYPLENIGCRTTQLSALAPEEYASFFGMQYYINGELRDRKMNRSCALSGGSCGRGGIDALVPGFAYVYAIAPLLDEAGERIGPLTTTESFVMPGCVNQSHLGELDVSYILVRFADFPDEPFDIAHAEGIAANYPYSVRDYLETISYGRQTVNSTVYGWYALPGTTSDYCDEVTEYDGRIHAFTPSCPLEQLVEDARILASDSDGFDNSNTAGTNRRVVVVVHGASNAGYFVSTAGSLVSQSYFTTETVAHELGHSFGLNHSGYWLCPAGESVGPSVHHPEEGGCNLWTYGPAYDVMAVELRHYNSHHKYLAGYLDDTNIQTVRVSGEYTLRALEVSDASGVFQLRIPLYGDTFYFLEYRMPRDYDSNETFPAYATQMSTRLPMPQGVAVWFQRTRFMGLMADTYALLTSPPHEPVMVTEDCDFYDPYRRIRVQLIEFLSDDYARVSIHYDSD